ncbi:levanbiose-producing levanase [Paenibacillus mucilaginosus]|uniref:GH32 C-terminal domain-containing protein n=1 Tax=Paenibacillus mucilaginosus TaxID=61624 RepID=UPI003D206F74
MRSKMGNKDTMKAAVHTLVLGVWMVMLMGWFYPLYSYGAEANNVSGWTAVGGTWTAAGEGWRGTAPGGQNMLALSNTRSDDFTYEAEVTVETANAVGTLLLRSNGDGTEAYGLQVDPNLDRLRLFKTAGDVTLGEKPMTIEPGQSYKVRVRAEGTVLKVYWGTVYDPVLTVMDGSYAVGLVGAGAYNGSVLFQNVRIGSLLSNLQNWTEAGGSWTPHLDGVKAVTPGAANAFRTADTPYTDFVLEADLKVDGGTPLGTAGLLFRGNAAGTQGYVVNLDPNLDQVRLFDADGGATIASRSMAVEAGRNYRVEVQAVGSNIKVYIDGYAAPAISVSNARYTSGRIGTNAYNGTAYFQDVYAWSSAAYYTEKYRPQYHYSMARNWISDPNGLVYYEGEYHLFNQDGGKWTHGVSTDLLHWKRLPIALPWNDQGHIWSGSAVVDANDASGLFGGGSGLIAYYTMFHPDKPNGNQKIGIAYSKDKGRTWSYYGGNPVVLNPGGPDGNWDFRDPKVVWDGERSRWVMVVSGGDHVRFFTSTDLLSWTYASSFGYGAYLHAGVWECPDLFQLPVDGNLSNRKWVLSISTGGAAVTGGSSAEYFVGSFDGTAFTSDNPASAILRNEAGKDFYASMSFDGIPAGDGRRIWLGWMSNWDYPFGFPTTAWKHIMSVPRELQLKTIAGEGVRLVQTPVRELQSLRGSASSWTNKTITPGTSNLLAGLSSSAYEIEAEFELPGSDAASEFGFRLRQGGSEQTVVGYTPASSKLFVNRADGGEDDFAPASYGTLQEATLSPVSNRVKLRLLVDESSIEVFGGDGRVTFSNLIFPDPSSLGMSLYTIGGSVKVVSLNVYPLTNTWKLSAAPGKIKGYEKDKDNGKPNGGTL